MENPHRAKGTESEIQVSHPSQPPPDMSKESHTPEPWTADRCYDGALSICQMRHPSRLVCVNATADALPAGYDAAEANAARIVSCVNSCAGINPEAVPDLLSVLKEAYESLADGLESEGKTEHEWSQSDKRLIAKIEAAIAKAEKGAV